MKYFFFNFVLLHQTSHQIPSPTYTYTLPLHRLLRTPHPTSQRPRRYHGSTKARTSRTETIDILEAHPIAQRSLFFKVGA